VALWLGCGRPDLVRSLALQETPLFELLAAVPATRPPLEEFRANQRGVLAPRRSGDFEGRARHFEDEIAAGPGKWKRPPAAIQQRFSSTTRPPSWRAQ